MRQLLLCVIETAVAWYWWYFGGGGVFVVAFAVGDSFCNVFAFGNSVVIAF